MADVDLFDISDDDVLYSALDSITDDYLYALQLQEELNKTSVTITSPKKPSSTVKQLSSKTSIVDESWEYVDPTPDIFALFKEFNQTYFWGKLDGVEVRWSPRMTLCAGLCSYEGRGGLCSVRLSLPLLKLRPRKDLVQTLLHEMIHAFLFVTQNNKDHNAHGPEFCKHMHRLNKETGANITVYHTFHDEVDLYRQHWWKCTGPCQQRPPYYGILRRATNRAPGPNDPWWEDHKKLCGGTYIKFKEPEGYKDSKKRKSNGTPMAGLNTPSPKKLKGPTQQLIIPFSGTGHVLGSTTAKVDTGIRNRHQPNHVSAAGSPNFFNAGKKGGTASPRGLNENPRPAIATVPSVNNSTRLFSATNKGSSNVVSFGNRQPLGSNQATRLKSNSSSTVTITQRKPVTTTTSPRSTPPTAKGAKPKTKSPITNKKGSPSKLQTLREMFSKMNSRSPPKKWSNGKIRGNTVIRHESISSDDQGESSVSLGKRELSKQYDCAKSTKTSNGGGFKKPTGQYVVRTNQDHDNLSVIKQVVHRENGQTANHGNSNNGRQSTEPRNGFGHFKTLRERDPISSNQLSQKKLSLTGTQNAHSSEISQRILLCECPVCNQKVAETDINQHLDACLNT